MNIEKLRTNLSTLRHYPSYPGIVMPDQTGWRNFFGFMSTSLNKKEFDYRKNILNKIGMKQENYEIPEDDGYLIADMSQSETLQSALACAKKIVASVDWEEKCKSARKFFLIEHKLDLTAPENEAILKLATSPEMLRPISQYLGTLPILGGAAIWYSPNKEKEPVGSQLYHIDAEAKKQIKAFMPIEEICEDTGPLTILPAKLSDEVYNKLYHQGKAPKRNTKLEDDIIYSATSEDKALKIVGKPGTVAFVDTCRCYHYGSRAASKPRIQLHLHYYDAFCKMMPLWGRNDKEVQLAPNVSADKEVVQALLGKAHLTFTNVRTKTNFKKQLKL